MTCYGEDLQGPLAIDWLKEDLEAGVIKTDKYPRIDLPSIPKDQIEEFSKMASIGVLLAYSRGTWDTGRQWNDVLGDYKFTSVKEFVSSAFAKK